MHKHPDTQEDNNVANLWCTEEMTKENLHLECYIVCTPTGKHKHTYFNQFGELMFRAGENKVRE